MKDPPPGDIRPMMSELLARSGPAGSAQLDEGRLSSMSPLIGVSTSTSGRTSEHSAWYSFPGDLLAGLILGGTAHTVVAPVERVKLVLQTQRSNLHVVKDHHREYKGMLDAMRGIVREEGFWSLWRGNTSSMMRYYPSVGLNFAFKDYYRNLLSQPHDRSSQPSLNRHHHRLPPSPAVNFAAGAAAGATSLLFTYPLDIAHTRLATDIGTRKHFSGLRSFILHVYVREGLRGLYQGFPASVHGIVIHRSIYFGGFDTAKQLFMSDTHTHAPFWLRWLLAQLATTTAGLVSYPFDTVRHRMMMQSGMEAKMYTSTWDCWRKIMLNEGPGAFYKGVVSNAVRGTGAAFILVMYDEVKRLMHKRNVPVTLTSL